MGGAGGLQNTKTAPIERKKLSYEHPEFWQLRMKTVQYVQYHSTTALQHYPGTVYCIIRMTFLHIIRTVHACTKHVSLCPVCPVCCVCTH